jgi:predicted MPP superfamily phosphohydrolase
MAFEDLPSEFDGLRIAHVSDLHNTEFGEENEKLLKKLRKADPDIIAITGDILDSRRTDVAVAIAFLEKAVEIAPCYYVTGNHEGRIMAEYKDLKAAMENMGVTVLENRQVTLEVGESTITIAGIDDPNVCNDGIWGEPEEVAAARLQNLHLEEEGFTILLSHRPDLFPAYVSGGADLVLSGHVHGGQFRIPFIGGLYAPSQGLFPEYDYGLFSAEGTLMYVSRGLGNSVFPLRFHNRPEVVLLTLHQQ